MHRNILVPLDGSKFAEHALPPALGIAQRAGASVRVALIHTPVTGLYGGAELATDPSLDYLVRDSQKEYLIDVLKRLSSVTPVRVTSTLLEGPIADALHEYAVASQIDLIIMATHARGPFSRFWLGSVADRLAGNSDAGLFGIQEFLNHLSGDSAGFVAARERSPAKRGE